jgi:hypothetical protein
MLDRCQRQWRTAYFSRTAHTATGGLLARGRNGEDRRFVFKVISRMLIPRLRGLV